ncbi:hypothetical protein [Erythrobacter donghaensis]|uniref:hypothetical protein n=1 Tax=Erythrobacter donghaensis TaxID=267135 RepID=UPI000A37AA24|nr:hypothetical protein [Erythrobacter donghaensis]
MKLEMTVNASRMAALALLALCGSTGLYAQTAAPEVQELFQKVEGAYMMNVRKTRGVECQIAQFTGPDVNMMMVAQHKSGSSNVLFFTPINPVATSGRQNIRLDLSNGSASIDMTLDMRVTPHPNTADHWVLSAPISSDEATALLLSSKVSATSSDGIRLTTLAAPSALRTSAIKAYDACKAQL